MFLSIWLSLVVLLLFLSATEHSAGEKFGNPVLFRGKKSLGTFRGFVIVVVVLNTYGNNSVCNKVAMKCIVNSPSDFLNCSLVFRGILKG